MGAIKRGSLRSEELLGKSIEAAPTVYLRKGGIYESLKGVRTIRWRRCVYIRAAIYQVFVGGSKSVYYLKTMTVYIISTSSQIQVIDLENTSNEPHPNPPPIHNPRRSSFPCPTPTPHPTDCHATNILPLSSQKLHQQPPARTLFLVLLQNKGSPSTLAGAFEIRDCADGG